MDRAPAASRGSVNLGNLSQEVHTEVHTGKALNSQGFVNLVNLVNLFRHHLSHACARAHALVLGEVHKVHKVHIYQFDQWLGRVNLGFGGSHLRPEVHTRRALRRRIANATAARRPSAAI